VFVYIDSTLKLKGLFIDFNGNVVGTAKLIEAAVLD
jgi:hypothetical protein